MKAPHSSKPKNRPLRACLAVLCFLFFTGSSSGQCGNTLSSRSYDTLITGPGYGTYTLTFPQWNPDSGALVSVKLTASVSQLYGFTLKNADAMPSTYTILAGRYDQFSSLAAGVSFNNTTQRNIGIFSLQPGASVTSAPFAFLQNYANTDSITGAVAPFAGTGTLSFVYVPITYTDVHANNNASYSYTASAGDSIHFSISYQFCTVGLLASSLIAFTALPEDPSTVKLSWTMANEERGRNYEVQQSRDGSQFTTAGSLSSIGGGTGNEDYYYDWNAPADPAGRWYFRLKIVSADGRIGYSDIKQVELGTGDGGGLRLYPNPASDFVNLSFPGAGDDWQVDVFAADGRLVFRELYPAAIAARLNFGPTFSRGAYFVRATDRRTNQSYTSSFLVR